MYRESGGRHSYQSRGSGKSSHHGGREHGRRHHRESRREKQDSYHHHSSSSTTSDDMQQQQQQQKQSSGGRSTGGGYHRTGGFEIGIPTTSRRKSESTSSDMWFQDSTPQTPPSATPSYLSALALEPTVTASESGTGIDVCNVCIYVRYVCFRAADDRRERLEGARASCSLVARGVEAGTPYLLHPKALRARTSSSDQQHCKVGRRGGWGGGGVLKTFTRTQDEVLRLHVVKGFCFIH